MTWLKNIVSDVGAAHSIKQGAGDHRRRETEKDYEAWLARYYPDAVSKPMGFFHREFWNWLWQIEDGKPHPEFDAFFAIWSRGFGKTTSGNLAIAALGARRKRRYAWLLSTTQEQADSKLLTVRLAISKMGGAFLRDYPHMARARTETGQNLGFNTKRLICSDDDSAGFIVESIGLDKNVRGSNIEFQRPDIIIPDDVDALHDSPYVVEKNIETLTKSILMAGDLDSLVVLGLQNLIHRDSIFAQIADDRATFLTKRFVSGPHPAMTGNVKYELQTTTQGRRWVFLSGTPTWPEGFGVEACTRFLNLEGADAFETECQHNVSRAHDDATFREFSEPHHIITVSEMMRFYFGRKAIMQNLERINVTFDNEGKAAGLVLPRGEVSMAQDWGNNIKHLVATRWVWKPGERVPLSDSAFFIREMCWPSWPPVIPLASDPRAHPTYPKLYKAIIEYEQSLGLGKRQWGNREDLSVEYRLFSHERPEGSATYNEDFEINLGFWQIDTKQAAKGIPFLQSFLSIDHTQVHPFRVDPRTVNEFPAKLCKVCGWIHPGRHLVGRPRVYWVVADGQGELDVDKSGNLVVAPAVDEWGMRRTRFEYPRHRPRETSEGEEKRAPKVYDDFIDVDKALAGYILHMVKRLDPADEVRLKYREIYEQLQAGTYVDYSARETVFMSAQFNEERETREAENEGKSWLGSLDGWDG